MSGAFQDRTSEWLRVTGGNTPFRGGQQINASSLQDLAKPNTTRKTEPEYGRIFDNGVSHSITVEAAVANLRPTTTT